MIRTLTYFNPWDTIFDGNPQRILERASRCRSADAHHAGRARRQRAAQVQEKFAATYRAAGGDCQLHVFPASEHEWVATPGPQTDRAREMLKAFIARNLAA
jgi:acetyl esterase/lipase